MNSKTNSKLDVPFAAGVVGSFLDDTIDNPRLHAILPNLVPPHFNHAHVLY